MAVLEKSYEGTLHPSERYIKPGGEYQQLSQELFQHINALKQLLSGGEKQLYEQIENVDLQRNCISEKECFIDGFRLGCQMTWEIMHYQSPNYQ